jgi:hypothetical protein
MQNLYFIPVSLVVKTNIYGKMVLVMRTYVLKLEVSNMIKSISLGKEFSFIQYFYYKGQLYFNLDYKKIKNKEIILQKL